MTSPVGSLWAALVPKMGVGTEFSAFFNDERRRQILHGVFDGYYGERHREDVIFDTNRTWTGRAALLRELYPGARIVCCVREVWWIIDSIEYMFQKNPLQVSRLFNFKTGSSVFSRVDTLMNADQGLVGHAWNLLREAWFGPNADMLVVVQYESLVRDPATTIRRLYEELDEPLFAHDFGKLDYDEPAYDAQLGLPGMHRVRPRIEPQRRKSCLPPEVPAKYADASFWMRLGAERDGVTII